MEFIGEYNDCLAKDDGSVIVSFVAKSSEIVKARKISALGKRELASGKNKLRIDVTVQKEKRSVSANAYLWVLCEKIAQKIGAYKQEIYRRFIVEQGIYKHIEINDDAADTFITAWGMNGIGWIAEKVDKGEKGYTIIHAYYGSSVYNKAQMAKLIDLVVEECKMLEIETKTPKEIAEIIALWGGK